MLSGLPISCVSEVVGAFGCGVSVEQLADGGGDGVEGSRRSLAQKLLELGEDLFDRVQIGGVFREKEQLRPG
jgi:hypothetical protein